MRASAAVFLLFATFVTGCDVTIVNPAACKLKDPDFCGAGMYCDQSLNACRPGSALVDGGVDSGGDGAVPTCQGFCVAVAPEPGSNNLLNAIYGTSATDVWTVGELGKTMHWDGTAWKSTTSGTTVNLRGVWGSAANNFYAVGDGGLILHWDRAPSRNC